MPSEDTLTRYQAQFHPSATLHFNNAGQSLVARVAKDAVESGLKQFFEMGALSYPLIEAATQQARADVAALLNCDAQGLAFFPGTAAAISQVAFGLDLQANDEIIVWDQEYPSNHYPWLAAAKRAGAKVITAKSGPQLETPIETLAAAITVRTKVIAVSWVQYRTGAITDLKALGDLARPRGIFTSVDVIQGLGALPFDFQATGIDAVCGGSHKWMCAVHGTGFMGLRAEHVNRLTPLAFGAMTYGGPDQSVEVGKKPVMGSGRFEPGGKAFLEILALGAAARLIRDTGIDRIAQELEWLSKKLLHGLREAGYLVHSPHGSHHRGSIVNFSAGPHSALKTEDEIAAKLTAANCSFSRRAPGIRLAPHAYNTAAQIEQVIDLVSQK